MHHGVHLRDDELVAAEQPAMLPSMLRSMRKLGLKGRALRQCSWEQAGALGTASICNGGGGATAVVIERLR